MRQQRSTLVTEQQQTAESGDDFGGILAAAGLAVGGMLAKKAWSARGGRKRGEDSQARFSKAQELYYVQGDPIGAMRQITEAIKLDPESYLAHNSLAWWLATTHSNLDQAVAHANEAVKLHPSVETYGTLAEALSWQGETQRAYEICSEILKYSANYAPGLFYAHFRRGEILRVAGQHDQAIAEYQAAANTVATTHPYDQSHVHVGLAAAYNAKRDYAMSAYHYRVASALRPGDANLPNWIAWAEKEAGAAATAWASRQPPPTRPAAAQVFISYAREDEEWLGRLHNHLAPFERTGAITSWDDQRSVRAPTGKRRSSGTWSRQTSCSSSSVRTSSGPTSPASEK